MYLSALTIGYAVPTCGFEAVVHSAFQSAVNLRLTQSGELLTLVCSSEADLPQGIRLDTPADFSFARLAVGELVTCRDSILRIDSISLMADLHKARVWKCDLPALRVDLTDLAVKAAWESVWQVLNQRQLFSGAEILADDLFRSDKMLKTGISQKAGEAIQSLLQAMRQNDLATASTSTMKLIGLGKGLTPAGDDLLMGYLAGLWSTIHGKPECQQLVSDLGERIIRLSRRTNDISRTYLYHAARGQVSSRLMVLVEAISHRESGEPLLTIAGSAMCIGHTSGMDAVTGLLIGLMTWVPSTYVQAL